MTDRTAVWEAGITTRITEKCQSRISHLIEKELEQTIIEARDSAREEARREAVGIIAEARRRAEEIVITAKQAAARLITEAKERVQAESEKAERQRVMSEPFPNVVPPPFVDKKAERTHYGRMPVFWA